MNHRDFELCKALEGDRCITESGKMVSEICYFETSIDPFPVIVIIDGMIRHCTKSGEDALSPDYNLKMAQKGKTLWMAILDKKDENQAAYSTTMAFESKENLDEFLEARNFKDEFNFQKIQVQVDM